MQIKLFGDQWLLFPKNPRDLAESIGLDWWAAKKLYDDKWLSFDPETELINSSSMESEFIFLGSLVAAGCDPRMLKRLLTALEKPYFYDISKIYYNWPKQRWEYLPYNGLAAQIVAEVISSLEDNEDFDGLEKLKNEAQEAINRLNAEFGNENGSKNQYICNFQDVFIESVRQMLWKIAASTLIDSPQKTIVVGKLFKVFQTFPEVILNENISLNLIGPRRKYGEHEIYHFWDIELEEEGYLRISSAGHFYRPSTGGDSFTSMTWEVSPGNEPVISDYLHQLELVDDADTFENEVKVMDFESDGYKLEVQDSSLEDWPE